MAVNNFCRALGYLPEYGFGRRAAVGPLFMRIAKISIGIACMLAATSVLAATKLDFWHSYVHAQTHETHYGFYVSRYKRGLFWGSCGPSTKSQQWSFTFDLAGAGPVYASKQCSVSDDNGKSVPVVAGQVVTDMKRHTAKIDIEVESAGRTNKFVGNGEYPINKLK